MSVAVYLLGAPGAGKTTVMAALVGPDGSQVDRPVPHVIYPSGWTQIGRERGAFSGTDALAYSIAPAAASWVRSEGRPDRLGGEGDRLASDGFLAALHASYDVVVVAYLHVARDVSYRRMVERAAPLERRPQSLSWWKGRCTKTERLAQRWGGLFLDGRAPAVELAAQVAAAVDLVA